MRRFNLFMQLSVLFVALLGLFSCEEDSQLTSGGESNDSLDISDSTGGVVDSVQTEFFVVLKDTVVDLQFTANSDWVMRSSKSWCVFPNAAIVYNGAAGEQSVTLTITDDEMKVFNDTADIQLIEGTEEKIIARIVRLGDTPVVMNASGVVYNDSNIVEIKHNANGASGYFTFKANFDWTLESCPSWLTTDKALPISTEANVENTITFTVETQYWTSAQFDTLYFCVQGTDIKVPVYVEFAGMQDGEIAVDGIDGAYWWIISADGLSFHKESIMGGDGEAEDIPFPFSFNVYANDNQYKILQFEQSGEWLNYVDEFASMKVVDDAQGNVEIESVQANSSAQERIAYILALPTDVYEKAKEESADDFNMVMTNSKGDDLNDEYLKYVIMAFKQQGTAAAGAGISIVNGMYESVEFESGDGGLVIEGTEIGSFISGEYGVPAEDIYTVRTSAGASLIIDPMISDWKNWEGNFLATSLETMEQLVDGFEPTSSMSGGMALNYYSIQENCFIIFKDASGMNKKALIVVVE